MRIRKDPTLTVPAASNIETFSAQHEFLVRVTRVRQENAQRTVFSALAINPDGRSVSKASNYAVVISSHILPIPVCLGQQWRIVGVPEAVKFDTFNNWRVEELQITATSATLERTSGIHIVALLAGELFPGIGPVTAQRLWDSLGDTIYKTLDDADFEKLYSVVGPKAAHILIEGWTYFNNTDLLQWMQKANLDISMGRKLLKVYGRHALTRLREDPYRLLGLGMSWQRIDELALEKLDLASDDPRRLAAAVEAELYDAFDQGDTFSLVSRLRTALRKRLECNLIEQAIDTATKQCVVYRQDDRVYAPGPHLLETVVSVALASRIASPVSIFTPAEVDALVNEFEHEERKRTSNPAFKVNEGQRLAIHASTACNFFCLIGGAGVGKTTTLNGITFVLVRADRPLYLLAPTGKAAKRVRQTTGHSAMTIHGFLRNTAYKGVAENAIIVVDEASMLDIKLAYQLLKAIPPSVRVILVGDSAQLPPVGPGLTLHELAACDVVQKVELTEGKRFAGGIALLASAVREGHWTPISDSSTADISIIPCSDDELASLVVDAYLKDPLNSQVLCCTKESGAASSKRINEMCQQALCSEAPKLTVFNEKLNRLEDTGFRLGDPVMCVANLWDYDLQNGSIGRIEHIEPSPVPRYDDTGACIEAVYGWVLWDDGERRPLTIPILDALELAYAITVHKSQGSEMPLVIIPVYRARNLDRTILYTAITRARVKVILIGDISAAQAAVKAEPHAAKRKVMLGNLLKRELAQNV